MGYFKRLRRKIGVLTLALACVLMANWLRDLTCQEHGEFVIHDWSVIIPHWSIVIPLMLLSAWLLLSKIRSPKPQTEPAPPKA